ncbi:Uncharacterized protein APZ42_005387, partial [Daphnia magna]
FIILFLNKKKSSSSIHQQARVSYNFYFPHHLPVRISLVIIHPLPVQAKLLHLQRYQHLGLEILLLLQQPNRLPHRMILLSKKKKKTRKGTEEHHSAYAI